MYDLSVKFKEKILILCTAENVELNHTEFEHRVMFSVAACSQRFVMGVVFLKRRSTGGGGGGGRGVDLQSELDSCTHARVMGNPPPPNK